MNYEVTVIGEAKIIIEDAHSEAEARSEAEVRFDHGDFETAQWEVKKI